MGAVGNDPADRELALRVYTSRIIGQDHNLVLHGGGNTSCNPLVKTLLRGIIGEANAASPPLTMSAAPRTIRWFCRRMFLTQGRGGKILFNVSKQAVNPGKGFGAYGILKAATMFLLRREVEAVHVGRAFVALAQSSRTPPM